MAGFFPEDEYADVLVGLGQPDDAAVFRLDAEKALIKTTDFFTPVVDDPWTFGAIAAVNAMSDVYAMGGDVLFALNIAGFPEEMDRETIAQIFAGGATKVREAGAAIAGGHTITGPEPFYGMSVTGLIHPDRIMRKSGAQAGDRLFLTKPLGTGVITTAAKLTGAGTPGAARTLRRIQGKPDLDPKHLGAAILSMLTLNRGAARAAQAAGVKAATDITGFGLLGHAVEMARPARKARGVVFQIQADKVPALPGVMTYIQADYLTLGRVRNPEHYGDHVRINRTISPEVRILLWESETSGGLLVAVPADQVETFTAVCGEQEQACWEIGQVIDGAPEMRSVEVI